MAQYPLDIVPTRARYVYDAENYEDPIDYLCHPMFKPSNHILRYQPAEYELI